MLSSYEQEAERSAHHPLPRCAAQDSAKIATISRVEGGRVHARVGRALVLHYKANYIPVKKWTR